MNELSRNVSKLTAQIEAFVVDPLDYMAKPQEALPQMSRAFSASASVAETPDKTEATTKQTDTKQADGPQTKETNEKPVTQAQINREAQADVTAAKEANEKPVTQAQIKREAQADVAAAKEANERPVTQAQINREAEADVAAAKKANEDGPDNKLSNLFGKAIENSKKVAETQPETKDKKEVESNKDAAKLPEAAEEKPDRNLSEMEIRQTRNENPMLKKRESQMSSVSQGASPTEIQEVQMDSDAHKASRGDKQAADNLAKTQVEIKSQAEAAKAQQEVDKAGKGQDTAEKTVSNTSQPEPAAPKPSAPEPAPAAKETSKDTTKNSVDALNQARAAAFSENTKDMRKRFERILPTQPGTIRLGEIAPSPTPKGGQAQGKGAAVGG